MKVTHVTLNYYKDTGKWYSEGEVDLPFRDSPTGEEPLPFYECLARVRAMLARGERPGLVNGYGFNVLITVYTEYGPLTSLFVPLCCICHKPTTDSVISTGDINAPTMKPCCNSCFKDMVCP